VHIIYECKGCDDILNVQNIKQMYELEQKVLNHQDYGDFCLAMGKTDTSCSSSGYNSIVKGLLPYIGSLTQTDVDVYLNSLVNSGDGSYKYLVCKDFEATGKCKYMRAVFTFANPIEHGGRRYRDPLDDELKQREDFVDFAMDLRDIVKDASSDSMTNRIFNQLIIGRLFIEVINRDLQWAAVSFLFVWVYVTFHLGSFYLGLVAMFNILISFPLSIVSYR
jgi:hypothetical protein